MLDRWRSADLCYGLENVNKPVWHVRLAPMRADGVDTLCNILARSQKRARKTSLVCFTSMQHGKNFISRNKMEILCDYALTYLRMLFIWMDCESEFADRPAV